RFHCRLDRTRHHAGRAASWVHNDDAARDRWLDPWRPYRPIVLQAGTWFLISSGRIHHVDHWRDHSAFYLDQIGGLTRHSSFSNRSEVRGKERLSAALWMSRIRPRFSTGDETKVLLPNCLAFFKLCRVKM